MYAAEDQAFYHPGRWETGIRGYLAISIAQSKWAVQAFAFIWPLITHLSFYLLRSHDIYSQIFPTLSYTHLSTYDVLIHFIPQRMKGAMNTYIHQDAKGNFLPVKARMKIRDKHKHSYSYLKTCEKSLGFLILALCLEAYCPLLSDHTFCLCWVLSTQTSFVKSLLSTFNTLLSHPLKESAQPSTQQLLVTPRPASTAQSMLLSPALNTATAQKQPCPLHTFAHICCFPKRGKKQTKFSNSFLLVPQFCFCFYFYFFCKC